MARPEWGGGQALNPIRVLSLLTRKPAVGKPAVGKLAVGKPAVDSYCKR